MSPMTVCRSGITSTLVIAAVLLATLAGCQSDSSKKSKLIRYPEGHFVTFAGYDQNYSPLAGVDVYVDSSLAPASVTDSSGNVSLDLSGIHDVHFVIAGHAGRSFINRDWSTVSTLQVLRLPIYPPGSSAMGTISGSISPTSVGDPIYRVRPVRLDDGLTAFVATSTGSAGSTPYTMSHYQGNQELYVYPTAVNITPAQSYAGYAASFALTGAGATVNPTVSHGGGLALTVSSSNGITGGLMSSQYNVFRDPYGVSLVVTTSSNQVGGVSLPADPVTVPPFESVFPGAYYEMSARSQTAAINTRPLRTWEEIYGSFAALASISPAITFTLPDFGYSIPTPLDGDTNQGVFPTFTWSLTGNPDFTEIVLSEYQASYGFYLGQVWQASVYGQTSVTYPAVMGPLATDTAYQYTLQGRINLKNAANQYIGTERDGWTFIRFGTGPTATP